MTRYHLSRKLSKYYTYGNRQSNIYHTRLRTNCSKLHTDLYRVNIKEDMSCTCGAAYENIYHYFLICPRYHEQRYTLRNSIPHVFDQNAMLYGNANFSIEENQYIFQAVQNYIKILNVFM